MFIGYNLTHKDYLCLLPTAKLYISCHVLFDENVFSFLSHFSTISCVDPDMISTHPSTLALIPSSTIILSFVVTPNITHFMLVSPSLTSSVDLPSSPLIQNNHPMITHGKYDIFKPITHTIFVQYFSIPTTVNDVLHQPHWYATMHEEYKALCANQTWTLTTLPPDIQPIGCK